MHQETDRSVELSIIIVNWNTWDLVRQLLASINSQAPRFRYEVWVVDNASTQSCPTDLLTSFPQVHFLQNTTNVGFARANNQAIQCCAGQYVLLLNSDTVVLAGALQILVDAMVALPKAGAVGARLLNQDGSLQASAHPNLTLFREGWRLFHLDRLLPLSIYRMEDWPLEVAHRTDVLMGACLLVRKQILDQIGLLDEDYYIYTEEVDLCYRIQQAGWLLYWVPQAEVIHFGGQSTKQMAEKMFIQLYRSKVQYFRKTQGRLGAGAYKLILLGAALLRIMASPLTALEEARTRTKHLSLSRQYMHLLKALPDL